MYQDKIEALKREIKRTYKRYMEETADKKATLLDLAKFFNIPVEESRIEDYVVKSFDEVTPFIEIVDERNATSYTATYTGNAELLNFSGPMQFNCVISTSPIRKEEVLYYIGSEAPIITRMTFTEGEYELVFEREMPNSVGGIFFNDGIKMAVRYLQNLVYDGKNVKQSLLNKIYENSYRNEKIDDTFEQIYTYGRPRFVKWNGSQDKYISWKDNHVIYGINELNQEGFSNYLYGICFESTNVPIRDYFPLNLREKDYPLLKDEDIYSAMIFRFGQGDGIHHSFQAYKDKEAIRVMYHSEKRHYGKNDYHKEILADEEYRLPILSEGTITSQEIKTISSSLQARLGSNANLDIMLNELNTFGTKMDIKNGTVQEEFDPLSPKHFIHQSFDEICHLISTNKEKYFQLISEQFIDAININVTLEKEKSKVLKPNNIQK